MKTMDFQKATANRINELFETGQSRVLLADEVGLGKTIIAREVVSLLAKRKRKFKVVYVCSNINIAAQNCRKLGIYADTRVSESRLSMQMLILQEKASNGNQLIPLTPATSFSMKGGNGTKEERAFIYAMLTRIPKYLDYQKQIGDLMNITNLSSWEGTVRWIESRIDYVEDSNSQFIPNFQRAFYSYIRNEKEIKKAFKKVLSTENVEDIEYDIRARIIRFLRMTFAKISLKTLKPDLVIMDEFQRFKELIDSENDMTEQGVLSKEFLSDKSIRVLLLSATPYKPYSTLEEIVSGDDEDHYSEFKRVMRFLNCEEEKEAAFEDTWKNYTTHLADIKSDVIVELSKVKTEAEDSLYQVICRTERRNDSIIDTSKAKEMKGDFSGDIRAFVDLQKLMDNYDLGKFPVEYAKSAPFLLSFMNYKVKEKILDAVYEDQTLKAFKESMYLKRRDIDSYKALPNYSARLNLLFQEVFNGENQGTEFLLWMPASMPYYDAKRTRVGRYFDYNKDYTKTLVFSSWEMVPRVIAALTSYESERLVYKRLPDDRKIKYFADDSSENTKSKRKGVHQRLTGEIMELISYPSDILAELYSPYDFLGDTIGNIRLKVKRKVVNLIREIKRTRNWHATKKSAASILQFIEEISRESYNLTWEYTIPNGIEDVLTDIAIGSPATCAYRIFHSTSYAKEIGRKIGEIFNKAESAAILSTLYGSVGTYYERVLKYCCEGNLQSVLDEYAFVLGEKDETLFELMKTGFANTASLRVETEDYIKKRRKTPVSLRTHFAVGYYNAKINDQAVQRTENIRNAFNSPFRPFVLATTSVGQEGLDFHKYARKVVHWNLPSNPIDIEQREGRVNRYLCHAIRQNLARNLNLQTGFQKKTSFWDTIMENAKTLKGSNSDLVPYWCLPEDYDPKYKIERIVPMYPYSSDVSKYNRLISILSMYRFTLGQPRQEELIQLIQNENLSEKDLEELYMNLSPWGRMTVSERAAIHNREENADVRANRIEPSKYSNWTRENRELYLRDVFGKDMPIPEDFDKAFDNQMSSINHEKIRTILIQKYKEGKPIRQIAENLGISPQQVYNLRNKGLRLLRHPSRRRYLKIGL